MAGIIKEGDELTKAEGTDAVLDAALIGAAQRAEHYEIAAYGTLSAMASLLGQAQAQRVIDRILDEEKKTDLTLTNIAGTVNECAMKIGGERLRAH